MGRINTSLVACGLLCSVFILPAVTDVPGTLFKILGDDKRVCALLRTSVNITITALQNSKVIGVASFNDSHKHNAAFGNCLDNVTLVMGGAVGWSFREYLRFEPEIDYMMTRAVSFVPHKVFGNIAPSNKTEVYGNQRDAVLGRPTQSYLCTDEDNSRYIKPKFATGFSESKPIVYNVMVDVKYLHIQIGNVKDGQFADARTCEHM